MSKVFFIFTFILFINVTNAQENNVFIASCEGNIHLISKPTEATPDEFASIELSWNNPQILEHFSVVNIEIQPMNDCFNDINGETYRNSYTFSIKELNNNQIFKTKISMNEVQRKCFKWRLLLESNNDSENCNKTSEWFFVPFVY